MIRQCGDYYYYRGTRKHHIYIMFYIHFKGTHTSTNYMLYSLINYFTCKRCKYIYLCIFIDILLNTLSHQHHVAPSHHNSA